MAKKSVESVSYRKMKGGGVVSTTNFKTPRGGQGGGPAYDYEGVEEHHATHKEAADHLGKMMFDTESGTDKEKSGASGYSKEDRGGPEKKEEIE